MNALTNGLKIRLEDSGKTYHTLNDWGLALGNNNYIGTPEQETTYINVPYRSGYIDVSEIVSGRPIFKTRALSFSLGGLNPRREWDSVISDFRNKVHGKVCRIIMDNDADHFYRGRVYVTDFDRFRELGTLTLSVPQAEPYKYNMIGYADPWEWDPFNFRNGTTEMLGDIDVNGTASLTIPASDMVTAPTFYVSQIQSTTPNIIANGMTFPLGEGRNYFPNLLVGGSSDITLQFNGRFHILVDYRGGSL